MGRWAAKNARAAEEAFRWTADAEGGAVLSWVWLSWVCLSWVWLATVSVRLCREAAEAGRTSGGSTAGV